MIRVTKSLVLAAALPSAFALAACGGVSKEDYAQDLDRICSDIEEESQDIGQAQAQSADQVSTQLDKLRTTVRDGVERMKDLERPDGEDGEKAEQYVNRVETTMNEQLLPGLDQIEQAVRQRDEAKFRAAATRLQSIDEQETRKLAEELGADECAEG